MTIDLALTYQRILVLIGQAMVDSLTPIVDSEPQGMGIIGVRLLLYADKEVTNSHAFCS